MLRGRPSASVAATLIAVVAVGGLQRRAAAQLSFTEVASAAGVEVWHLGPEHEFDCILDEETCRSYVFLSGFVVGDLDLDGNRDLLVPRFGTTPLTFIGDGTGSFSRRTVGVGLDDSILAGPAVLLDIEGDGDLDVFITGHGESRHFLYVNQASTGSMRFSEEAVERGIAAPLTGDLHAAASVSIADVDRDGDLDIYIGEWARHREFPCAEGRGRFFRNLGPETPGHFRDDTNSIGLGIVALDQPTEHSFESLFVDFDDDGWTDAWVSGDFGTSSMFWNEEGRFERRRPPSPGMNDMGATPIDFDSDGRLDLMVTGIYAPQDNLDGNRLYRNAGGREFTDVTEEAGVRNSDWGWGVEAADLDLDGDQDLVAASGFFSISLGPTSVHVYENDGGSFQEATFPDGIPGSVGQGRGVLAEDIDGDGDQDLLVSYFDGRIRIFRNDLPVGNAWLRVTVEDQRGGPGHGARVVVSDVTGRTQVRALGPRGGYTVSATPEAHFGFGELTELEVDLTVTFADGGVETRRVTLNQRVHVIESNQEAPRSAAGEIARSRWDCNGNDVPDACEPDCDADGTPDVCQVMQSPTDDCNANGAVDVCELTSGLAADCDGDGRIDACQLSPETDCDGDARLDVCQSTPRSCLMVVDAGAPPLPPSPEVTDVRVGRSCSAHPAGGDTRSRRDFATLLLLGFAVAGFAGRRRRHRAG